MENTMSVDRRISRTRRLLSQALIELVAQHPYETISIRDITEQADIGYATFFRHYDSKDALMLEIFSHLLEEIEGLLDAQSPDYFAQEGVHLFDHIKAHSALYTSILSSSVFRRKLQAELARLIVGHLEQHYPPEQPLAIPMEIAAHHMISALFGLIEWWLSQHQPYPIQTMASIYQRLIIQATWYAMLAQNTFPDPPYTLPQPL
jgi:AcrR family transcriptional regulator